MSPNQGKRIGIERLRLETRVALDLARLRLFSKGDSTRPESPVVLNSLPKSGTHLALKLLESLPGLSEVRFQLSALTAGFFTPGSGEDAVDIGVTLPRSVSLSEVRRRLGLMPPGSFISAHVPYSEALAQVLRDLNYRMLVLLRDPRDVAVSSAAYIASRASHPLHHIFEQMDPSRRHMASIAGVQGQSVQMQDLRTRVESIRAWRDEPNAIAVRFEDLVGPLGGGDVLSQQESILAVAQHIGVELDEFGAQRLAENLYGGTATFRKGQIGGWREAFSAADRRTVGRLLGDVLCELGYEENDSWWQDDRREPMSE